MSFEAAIHAKAIQLNQAALDLCAEAGNGHPTSALSVGHLVTVLLYHTMRWMPEDPACASSDRLVLSGAHAVPILYAAGADLGLRIGHEGQLRPMTAADARAFRSVDAACQAHPSPTHGFPFADAVTASPGQGLSIAAGLGLAARRDESEKRIWCIVGDGESREGQVWEAIDFLVDHRLTNVIAIVQCNQYGQSDKVSSQQSHETIARKLEAAGVQAITIDGHDPRAIRDALERAAKAERVTAIVARTVKGWGAPCIQGGAWHGKPPLGEKLRQAKDELTAQRMSLVSSLVGGESLKVSAPAAPRVRVATVKDTPSFTQAMRAHDFGTVLATGRFATRKAYGLALRALGAANPDVWALDADSKNVTGTEWFANDRTSGGRFVECRVAEQNMVSVAVGLSAAGKIPFVSTFARSLTRAHDQIEMALHSGANLKLVGTSAGATVASDGPSVMTLSDVAWFRSLSTARDHRGNPGCYLLQPSDAYAAFALTMVMAEYQGMCSMRTFRQETEFLYGDSTVFNLGKFEVLNEGRDLLIVSAGLMVHECNKALAILDRQGIDATLVDLYSIPFDREALLDLANANGGNILVVEDTFGGAMGSAVADACTDSGDAFTLQQMHVERLPGSARTDDELLTLCGLHATQIAARAARIVGVGSASA
jgi:transketolase